MKAFEPTACEECGATPVLHKMTYYSILIDDALLKLLDPGIFGRLFKKFSGSVEEAVSPYIFKGLVALGLATIVERPDKEVSLLGETLWAEADAEGIVMKELRLFGLARNLYLATLPGGRTITFEGIPGLPSDSKRVAWMDDKFELKKQFTKRGFPVARGGKVTSLRGARKLFRTLTAPVVVKPNAGSFSRHTIMHVADETELERAYGIAHQVSPEVVIEEELKGRVFRATVVNGEVAATIGRDQPAVVGDGVHTVRELVAKENENPHRRGPYFGPIALEGRADKELAWQGFTQESVPEQGRRATLHQKINWTVGGTTTDVTDDVHPENLALFVDATKATNASINGIDFIIDDITRSWKEQGRCGILECNSMPLFENHHLPFYGKPQNVAKHIWRMVIEAEKTR